MKIVKTQYGGKALYPKLMSPEPDTTYLVSPNPEQVAAGISFEHVFITDAHSFVESAYVEGVQFFGGGRAGVRHSKDLPGKPAGNYDRGHIISAEMGAGMENVNLLWMPSAINRNFKPGTAEKHGHPEIAEHMKRHLDVEHHSGGTLSQSGEFYLPNYRIFEGRVKYEAREGMRKGYTVSVCVRPATYTSQGRPLTDILHTEIFLDDKPVYRYKITSEI
jgi:hypothetical protein